jgi:pimeloyl-ACP methyl ester carboxylesterase
MNGVPSPFDDEQKDVTVTTSAEPTSRQDTITTAPTRFLAAGQIRFAYRRFGRPSDTPTLVLLQHFMGNLDNHDPAVTGPLAAAREVIAFDNAGVGASGGTAPETVAEMARDAASFIDAFAPGRPVDLFGFSMGGHVAQQLALDRPDLVRRLVLAGTAPRGGHGMAGLATDVAPLFARRLPTQQDMWLPIFFPPSAAGQRAGRRFVERIRARVEDRDLPVAEAAIAAHRAAAAEWGRPEPDSYDYLRRITQPTLVVNGSDDVVVPTINSYVLSQHLPDAELVLYPDSGHGSHFQYSGRFTRRVIDFLDPHDEDDSDTGGRAAAEGRYGFQDESDDDETASTVSAGPAPATTRIPRSTS